MNTDMYCTAVNCYITCLSNSFIYMHIKCTAFFNPIYNMKKKLWIIICLKTFNLPTYRKAFPLYILPKQALHQSMTDCLDLTLVGDSLLRMYLQYAMYTHMFHIV